MLTRAQAEKIQEDFLQAVRDFEAASELDTNRWEAWRPVGFAGPVEKPTDLLVASTATKSRQRHKVVPFTVKAGSDGKDHYIFTSQPADWPEIVVSVRDKSVAVADRIRSSASYQTPARAAASGAVDAAAARAAADAARTSDDPNDPFYLNVETDPEVRADKARTKIREDARKAAADRTRISREARAALGLPPERPRPKSYPRDYLNVAIPEKDEE